MTIAPLNTPEKNPNWEKNAKRKINELVTAVNEGGGGGGGASSWGQITGTLSNQTDLQTALNAKQNTLVAQTATLDFGALSYNASVSIADTSVTGTTRVIPSVTVTGRDADELEMTPIVLAAYVTAGVGIDIYGYAPQGADGQFLISYIKA